MEPHLKYLHAQVMTASPEKLVLMLYDALIRYISQAKLDISEERIDQANENLCKVNTMVSKVRFFLIRNKHFYLI